MGSGFNMLIFNIVDRRIFAIVQLIYGLAYFLIINRLIDIRILHITIIVDNSVQFCCIVWNFL